MGCKLHKVYKPTHLTLQVGLVEISACAKVISSFRHVFSIRLMQGVYGLYRLMQSFLPLLSNTSLSPQSEWLP